MEIVTELETYDLIDYNEKIFMKKWMNECYNNISKQLSLMMKLITQFFHLKKMKNNTILKNTWKIYSFRQSIGSNQSATTNITTNESIQSTKTGNGKIWKCQLWRFSTFNSI